MSEDKLYEDVRRGHEAQTKLESLKDDLAYLEQAIIDAWRATGNPDHYAELKGLQKFRDHLQGIVTSGRLADVQVQQLVRRQKQTRKYA